MELREIEVYGLTMDPRSQGPVVLLREKNGERILPIWVGMMEASAIALEIDAVQLQRPLTHDLLKMVTTMLGAQVKDVAIVELKENTYYAVLHLQKDAELLEVDCRPSDAIALALCCEAPIMCADFVLDKASVYINEIERDQEAPSPSDSEPEGSEVAPAKNGPRSFFVDPRREFDEDAMQEIINNMDTNLNLKN